MHKICRVQALLVWVDELWFVKIVIWYQLEMV